MRNVLIKEGPLVFLRNVLVMEFLALILFVGASYITNYEMLLDSFGIIDFIRYDLFMILAFSLFQFIYIVILFFDWYFTYYEIHESEIVRKSGLMYRRRKSVLLTDIATLEIYQSPIARLMHHATIILEHGNGRVTKIKNVGNYTEYVQLIKHALKMVGRNLPPKTTHELIKLGEGKSIEFKETLRYDTRKNEVSKEVERSSLKTIVGFMNTDGGTLIIGVSDSKEIVGLNVDYNNLPRKDRDGFENHLAMLIKNTIGLAFSKYISVNFEEIEGKEVCIISIVPSHKPVYLTGPDKRDEFFVRVGNSTQSFTMSDAEEYIKNKWR